MTQRSAVLSVAALFLSGVAIGALGMHLYDVRAEASHSRSSWSRTSPEDVWRELQLTPEQREQVRQVLAESQERALGIRDHVRPQVIELVEDTRRRLDEILEPQQQARLDALRERYGRRFERWLLGEYHHHSRDDSRRRPRRRPQD